VSLSPSSLETCARAADLVVVRTSDVAVGEAAAGERPSAPPDAVADLASVVAAVRRARAGSTVAVWGAPTEDLPSVGAVLDAGVDEVVAAPDAVPVLRLAAARAVLGSSGRAGADPAGPGRAGPGRAGRDPAGRDRARSAPAGTDPAGPDRST
jgi:hypothetical protein